MTSVEESFLLARVAAGTAAARTLATVAVSPELRARLEAEVADAHGAKERLVLANLHLVPAAAQAWVGHLPFADLVQEGSLGLVRAVEAYTPERGSFSGYARRWVRRSIARAVSAVGPAATTWATDAPVDAALAEAALGAGSAALLAAPVEMPDGAAPGPVGEPAPAVQRSVVSRRIRQALDHLDALEAKVLELRFGLVDGMSRSLDEIGRRLGVTRERVRQLLEGALAHIRQVFEPADAVMA